MRIILILLLSLFISALSFDTFAAPNSKVFQKAAFRVGIDPIILEGVCRYESDSGLFKQHHNKNGTWDVGFCQNHRYYKGDKPPRIPTNFASIKEAAKELKYWYHQHERFCVYTLKTTNKCGYISGGKFRGVKNCKRPHHWFHHYNSGFRVLKNNYGDKIFCFIRNGFKKCKDSEWKKLKKLKDVNENNGAKSTSK